jgi:hypothetical protein
MTVIVVGKFRGDTEAFRRFVAERGDLMQKIGEEARSQGAIHHRFAVGDGFVFTIDEWESVDAFQQFFQTNADIPTAMQEAGAQGEPEFEFAEAIDTADQF